MPRKIISRVKEVMNRKGITVQTLCAKTGLPKVTIHNACSEKIIYCGLNILNALASAMDVSIKDLFEEVDLSRKRPPQKKVKTSGTNISAVTNKLINLIMKMSTYDKEKLFDKFNEYKKSSTPKSSTANVATDLIELVMNMSLDDRCLLLGDFMSYTGATRRKYGRSKYLKPIHFTVRGALFQGNTKNISLGGVFIETKGESGSFAVGDPITMNFEHPQSRKYFRTTGKIVWIGKNGIGVSFDKII